MRTVAWFMLACALTLNPVSSLGAEADATQPDETESATSLPPYTSPKVVYRPEIKFPNQSREAVVYVHFLISKEGLPVQIVVDELRGFHSEEFKNAALKYVQDMRFEPARLNGEPVEAGPLVQPINFSFQGEVDPEQQFVSDAFKRELDKVENLLRKKDYPGAHFHAEWMLREKVQLQFEYAVLQAQLAQTHARVGNLEEAFRAATAATIRKVTETPGFQLRQPAPRNDPRNYLLPKQLIVYLLELRMRLEAQRGQVLAALKTYNELAGLTKVKPKDQSAVLAETLTTLLESDRPLVLGGKVTGEFWSHEQFHPSFTIINVKGKIDLFHVHCRGEYREHPYAENAIWSIPAGAKACVVEVYGESGATFDFVELSAAAAAALPTAR